MEMSSSAMAVLAAGMGEAVFDTLFHGCRPERFSAGETLFIQDDPSDRLYGVLSGTVEISILSPEGQKLLANIERSKSMIGEIGALDGGRRTATATCRDACEIVSISRRELQQRIDANPGVARSLIELLCKRLRWVSNEFGDQAFLDVEARLAKRLLFLSSVMADPRGWIRISQSELADFLGAARESVNKILNDWRGRDLIELRRGGVRLVNLGRLGDIVGDFG